MRRCWACGCVCGCDDGCESFCGCECCSGCECDFGVGQTRFHWFWCVRVIFAIVGGCMTLRDIVILRAVVSAFAVANSIRRSFYLLECNVCIASIIFAKTIDAILVIIY